MSVARAVRHATSVVAVLLALPATAAEGFVKGSGPEVYTVHAGRRHWVPNATCLAALGGDPATVQVVPDAELLATPEGAPALCHGRSFIRFTSGPVVYMAVGNTLRPFATPECAFEHGLPRDLSGVINVDARYAREFAIGRAVCAETQGPGTGRPEGRFVKGSSATIYAVHGGMRHAITDPGCYAVLGGAPNFSDTTTVSDAEIFALPEGAPTVCAERAFVKFTHHPAVYLATGNTLRPFPDPGCAFAHGVAQDWSGITQLDPSWSSQFAIGTGLCGPAAAPVQVCLPNADLDAIVAAIDNESFSSGKLGALDLAAGSRSFCVAQVARILESFSFSADQVAVVTRLRGQIGDRQNAFQLLESFTFSGDKEKVRQLLK